MAGSAGGLGCGEGTSFRILCSCVRMVKCIKHTLGMYAPYISSVQFSRSVVSDSLWPHESQHARPPCPSPTPGVHSDSHPLSLWCHPAISSSVVPFSSCPQSLPESGSFPMSQLFARGDQSIGTVASASVSLMTIQISFRIDWFDLLLVQGTLKSLLQHQNLKPSILQHWAFFMVQLSYPCVTTGQKP